MSTASKFSLQSFDENLCLNCSTQFVKDGVIQLQKLTYLEVIDDGSIVKRESISISSVLNCIFKLPLSKQINENEELPFGCCPACATVLSRLYQLHKQLEDLSDLNSVISNIIMDMKLTVKQSEEPLVSLTATSRDTTTLSHSQNASTQASPTYMFLLDTPMNNTKNCSTCCVKLYSGPVNSICSLEARRAVSSAVLVWDNSTESRTIIAMPDVLKSILNLPQNSSITRNINLCVECAPAILEIFRLYKSLRSRPESYFNFMLGKIQSWISRVLTSIAQGEPATRIVVKPNSSPLIASSLVRVTPVPARPTGVSPTPIPRIRKLNRNTISEVKGEVKATSEGQSLPFEDPMDEASDSGESPGHLTDSDSGTHQTVVDAPTRIGILVPRKRSIRVDVPNKNGRNGRTRESPSGFVPVTPAPVVPNAKPRIRKHVADWVIKGAEPVENPIHNSPMKVVADATPDPVVKPQESRIRISTDLQAMERARARKRELKRKRYKEKGSIPPIIHDPCPQCGKVYVNRNRNWMKYHIAFSHAYSITSISCDTCGRPCSSSTEKRQHAKSHLNAAERLQNHQEDPQPTFLCQECGKILMTESTLKTHSKIHEDVLTRQIHCPELSCDFTCFCKKTLEIHRNRVHDPTAVPKFKCEKCNESFRLHTELKEHEMVSCDAHNRPFACDQSNCTRRFKLKQALVLHLYDVHKLRPAEAREKIYPGLDCPNWVGRKRINKKRSHK